LEETWIEACRVGDVDQEDVIRFDYEEQTFAIYRSPDETFYATEGTCTHEHAHHESIGQMDS